MISFLYDYDIILIIPIQKSELSSITPYYFLGFFVFSLLISLEYSFSRASLILLINSVRSKLSIIS